MLAFLGVLAGANRHTSEGAAANNRHQSLFACSARMPWQRLPIVGPWLMFAVFVPFSSVPWRFWILVVATEMALANFGVVDLYCNMNPPLQPFCCLGFLFESRIYIAILKSPLMMRH